jgi:tRNA modification GTPase
MSAPEPMTIFAPATAPGRAAIAVLRISGRATLRALASLSLGLPPPRRATRVRFVDTLTGEALDDGLVLFFPGPHSVTGEDVAELHLHGGRAVQESVMAALHRLPELRLAEPGEFTRRAFENGKLDLTEAEAIADLVAAETAAQRRQALQQLEGALGALYETWRQRLLRALAHLEAAIDFPEEELPDGLVATVQSEAAVLGAEIAAHLTDARRGEILRDGFAIAILGPPNAGKSSLLNAMAQRDVAITAATAGTTRDVIEVRLDLGGYPVILADTAGLRVSADPIESEGMRRAQARAAAADLRLLIYDVTRPEELGAIELGAGPTLRVANKADLLGGADRRAGSRSGTADALLVSLKTGEGVGALIGRLQQEVAARFAGSSGPTPTRARHREALLSCNDALGRAATAGSPELAAEDLRLAARSLGRITGRVDVEDLLDIIFRDFCIGK